MTIPTSSLPKLRKALAHLRDGCALLIEVLDDFERAESLNPIPTKPPSDDGTSSAQDSTRQEPDWDEVRRRVGPVRFLFHQVQWERPEDTSDEIAKEMQRRDPNCDTNGPTVRSFRTYARKDPFLRELLPPRLQWDNT